MNKLKTRNRLLFVICVAVYMVALSVFVFWDYNHQKNDILEYIDSKLFISAATLKYILPDDFHDRAIDDQAISISEDRYLANKITKLIRETGFKYTYTIVKKKNGLFFIIGDLTADPETKRGTFYYYPYEDADDSFIKAFDRDTPTYTTVSDQWGKVRTVMIPEKTPGGLTFLACADYDISYVKGLLQKNLLRSIVTALSFLLLTIPILILYTKSYYEYMADLREGREKYKELANSLPQVVFEMDNDGLITFVNRNAFDFFHFTQNDFDNGINAFQMLIPEDRDSAMENIQTRINGKEAARREYTAQKKDGSTFPVVLHVNPVFHEKKPIGFSGIVIDITERKQAEESLKKSENRYRTLFERSTDAIFIVERGTGRYLDANEAALRLSGRRLSKLKQLTTQDITPDGGRERLELLAESNSVEEMGKVTYVHPDGKQRVARLTTVPLDSKAIIGIAKDITDELAMEDKLRQAQKMEAIGTLAGGIAHDFNNILSAILGYSELALADLPSETSLRNKLEAIHSSGERARELVSQILAFSRKDELIRSPIEMHMIIKDAFKLLRPAIPTTINIQTQITSKSQILGDPTRLHQIIMNLCTNAYQAMLEKGGILKISLSDIELNDNMAKDFDLPAGSYAKLTISDSGVGIPSKYIDRIFDPYFTTKEKGKGTGLGLAAVHGIVKSHAGKIFVKSKIEKGTKFSVYLPLLAKREEVLEKQDESQIIGGNERILLVDDEIDILKVEEEVLKKLGYSIAAEESPQDALELFKKNPEQFDLVITDMTMPSMAGDKFAETLIKARSDIPVILCTGFSEIMTKERAESIGIKGFLMKPATMRDLSMIVRKVLDKEES